jgi:hypothetical protein
MTRVLGAATIIFGALTLMFDPNRWDAVVFELPRGHGIHLHDLIGMTLVAGGLAVLWYSTNSSS